MRHIDSKIGANEKMREGGELVVIVNIFSSIKMKRAQECCIIYHFQGSLVFLHEHFLN